MDPASLAAAFVGVQQGQLQAAVAAKMLKMKAGQDAAIVQMLEAAAQNANQPADVAPGIGQNLDVSA